MNKNYLSLPMLLIFTFMLNGCHLEDNPFDWDNDDDNNDNDKPNTSLLAYWSFEDGTARDFSGNGFDGRMMNRPYPVEGVNHKGRAMYFNGRGDDTDRGDHILLPYINFNRMNEFAITMWVKEDGTSHSWGAGESYIFFGHSQKGWLGIDHSYPKPDTTKYIYYSVGSKISSDINSTRTEFYYRQDRSNWVLYSLVYRDGMMYCYKDHEMVGRARQKVNVGAETAAIARHWWTYGSQRTSTRFIGAIDEVKIWKRALMPVEIISEYLVGGCFKLERGSRMVLEAPEGFESYRWSNGQTGRAIVVNNPGRYYVTVQTHDGLIAKSQAYIVE